MATKRLNIELPTEQHEFLQREANRTRTTIAGLIRKLVDDFRLRLSEEAFRDYQADPLYKRCGSFDGPDDLAEHHDRYLYGRTIK
jgi:hypothetical protein